MLRDVRCEPIHELQTASHVGFTHASLTKGMPSYGATPTSIKAYLAKFLGNEHAKIPASVVFKGVVQDFDPDLDMEA